MREVESRGRWPELTKTFLFNNGWGYSYVVDTVGTDLCWNVVRHNRKDDDHHLVKWEIRYSVLNGCFNELNKMWDLYWDLTEDWCLLEGLGDYIRSPEEFELYLGKLPTHMDTTENGELITFFRPITDEMVSGYLDDVSRQILANYIEESDWTKASVLLEILCDRLEETKPEDGI